MRNIMIQVWSPSKKTMSIGMTLPLLAGYLGAIYPNLSDEEFRQWTGFNDMDGKPVYEGDIIRFAGMGPYEIIFKDGAFRDRGGYYNLTDDGMKHFAEVIGNIYENPELLKI